MGNDKIELKDVLNFFEYEKVRDRMRSRVIDLKRVRRVPVGRHLSFVFENRDTVLFQIQAVLDRFLGIDTGGIDGGPTVWIQVGKDFAVPGEFEAGHSDEEKGKLSAVHFVRFRFPPEAVRAFRESPVYLVLDHPAERARVELPAATKAELLSDLRG